MKVENRDVSVLIQGGVDKNTDVCILSIKEMLYGAQIILSTWSEHVCNADLDVSSLTETGGGGDKAR